MIDPLDPPAGMSVSPSLSVRDSLIFAASLQKIELDVAINPHIEHGRWFFFATAHDTRMVLNSLERDTIRPSSLGPHLFIQACPFSFILVHVYPGP